jgi:hypothetical protein
MHNIVSLLTDGPRKIRSIPEEYVSASSPGSSTDVLHVIKMDESPQLSEEVSVEAGQLNRFRG